MSIIPPNDSPPGSKHPDRPPKMIRVARRIGTKLFPPRMHAGGRSLSSSHQMDLPPWLRCISEDTSPAPKLFAWSSRNLDQHEPRENQAGESPIKKDFEKRIHIVGIGNIGILLATALAQLPNRPPITLVVHKRELLEQWHRQPGLQITRNKCTDFVVDFDVEWWTDEEPVSGPKRQIADGATIGNLLVSTKASVALLEVDRVRRYLNSSSTVAFVQNGMCKLWQPYGKRYMALRHPTGNHPNWLACVTTHGVTSLGRFRSEHVAVADMKIGPVHLSQHSKTHSYLPETLCRAPFVHGEGVTSEELWILQLEKLVVNAIINPLTAILGCKNGKLFETPDGPLMHVVESLIQEASEVLQALIQHPMTDAILADPDRRHDLLNRFSAHHLRLMLLNIGHKVKDNTSSMLQDYRAGKGTEIQDFNGWLVDTAAFLDVKASTTRHEALVQLVESGARMDEVSLISYLQRAAEAGTVTASL
ncbi:ketopantoate reductase PanE/ApbA C terminal-domain-containing protein [Plectosphaerella cucumerina]|uniref:Ketopantoate reductase PanE/ApbA C terminal-domain-containing protein n=1 Tax=Plectosphaerella cucumerina TaxID=40658 RepID=A0A8K0TJG1_9PEZI|nr:ketopantoate reductase PanE/ApbA C terminal-domain-containing protein [Plectosphaerella cucumerina]